MAALRLSYSIRRINCKGTDVAAIAPLLLPALLAPRPVPAAEEVLRDLQIGDPAPDFALPGRAATSTSTSASTHIWSACIVAL